MEELKQIMIREKTKAKIYAQQIDKAINGWYEKFIEEGWAVNRAYTEIKKRTDEAIMNCMMALIQTDAKFKGLNIKEDDIIREMEMEVSAYHKGKSIHEFMANALKDIVENLDKQS